MELSASVIGVGAAICDSTMMTRSDTYKTAKIVSSPQGQWTYYTVLISLQHKCIYDGGNSVLRAKTELIFVMQNLGIGGIMGTGVKFIVESTVFEIVDPDLPIHYIISCLKLAPLLSLSLSL